VAAPISAAPRSRPGPTTVLLTVVAAIGVLALGGAVALGAFGRSDTATGPTASPTMEAPPAASPTGPATAEPSAPSTPQPTETATPEPTLLLVPAPLTGLPVTPAAAQQHPIAVMIDDQVDARPQAGFNAASIVWQAPAEGGIPRYMLIFQDQVPGDVGPVRSAREYFIEWAAEWRAMYVHAGGSPQALATLYAHGQGDYVWNADEFRWEGRYLWRVHGTRFAPHNVFTDGQHLRALATKLGAKDGPVDPAWAFAPDIAPEYRPDGGQITVTYPYEAIRYRYDPVTNTYLRYVRPPSGGAFKRQVDAGDGQPVAPKNVVILRMSFGPLNDGHPKKHRLEARNVGHGVAYIATSGRTVKGTWRKASTTAPTLLFGPDGKPIVFTAGQTFVEVMQLTDGIAIHDGRVAPTMVSTVGLSAR
jgi:hypothetical protein